MMKRFAVGIEVRRRGRLDDRAVRAGFSLRLTNVSGLLTQMASGMTDFSHRRRRSRARIRAVPSTGARRKTVAARSREG